MGMSQYMLNSLALNKLVDDEGMFLIYDIIDHEDDWSITAISFFFARAVYKYYESPNAIKKYLYSPNAKSSN